MKMYRRVLKRIAAGLLLILLAAGTSALINATLASREPENALPTIQVDYNGTPLPYEHVMLSSYSWRFLFITKSDELTMPDAWRSELLAAPVIAGAPLQISFSYPCKEITVSRADGNGVSFTECGGDLFTPLVAGTYTYRVEASWGYRGSLLYYFKIDVVA